MEAVILAAGFGRGLEPITHTRPKPLIPVIDKTLLEYHLDNLSRVGTIERVIVVANYLIDMIKERIKIVGSKYEFELKVVDQGRPLGTGHSLLKGLEEVRGESVVVLYVDSVYSVEDLVNIATSSSPYVIAAYHVDDPRDYGVLIGDLGGELKDVVEKPSQPISKLINAGLYKLSTRVSSYLERIEPSPRGEYELTDAIKLLIRSGFSVRIRGLRFWRDLGKSWLYLGFCKEALNERVREREVYGRVESGVNIKGPVYIGKDSEVLSGSYIEGPAYIGDGVTVGPNAYVRPGSIILSGSRIGFSVEVKESVVMEGVHAHHLSYIGDSVVCEYSNLGAGTILANLRLDEGEIKVRVKGVKVPTGRRKLGALLGGYTRTGVNVSLNPGVKVGAYSRIFPGVTVYEDVPPCSLVKPGGSIESLPSSECLIDKSVWC
ncbi:MAG: sugar phosphate nucleotidyltransferase [Sulfolobales archaeon]